MGVKYEFGILSAKYKNIEKTFKCLKFLMSLKLIIKFLFF